MLEVRLIGTFDIRCDGQPLKLSSRAAESLFAYLICTAGSSHRRERLAGVFWPDRIEKKARAYLRHELWRVRKALANQSSNEYLSVDDISVCFNPLTEYWMDVKALEDIRESASIDELIAALSNCQGEFLPGFYEEWITQEREHLQTVYEQKIAWLLESLEKEERWNDILEWTERWISLGSGAETAYRYLMTAYDALGDRAKVASTYQRYVRTLRELGLEPSEQTRALAFKRIPNLNIPIPLTSFVGRERELKEVGNLLSKSRLVTLTGSGGVGKTRIAIQVVADVLERFPDGVWFLDLAPLSDPALVSSTLVNLLGLRESSDTKLSFTDLLINYFRSRTALVIFDNCEHLIELCAQLVHLLLTSCDGLCILATSREALRVSGEIPYRVPSLEIPILEMEPAIDTLARIESIQLFAERAAVASPGFVLGPQNASVIVQICRRLDGIPLAIELTVARVGVLNVNQILTRLDDRFNLLTHGLRTNLPRHQTLRATIEWSYDLLLENERLLFRRLAVFSAGWTLEAAEQVCGGSGIESNHFLDLLSQLVNKSLVMVENLNTETRYRKLETIHQFAREKLIESGETDQLREMHLQYFLKKAEEIEPFLTGPQQSVWMDYLDLELDNLRLALEWSISNKKGEKSLRLCGALGWFWFIRCHIREGEDWSTRCLQLKDGISETVQAKALRSAGWMHFAKDDFSTSTALHYESLDYYRKLGDLKEISIALQFLGIVEVIQGNSVKGHNLFEESLDISRRINNKQAMPRVLIHLGGFSQAAGDYLTAWRYYEEALAVCRDIQEVHLTHVILGTMGHFALTQRKNNLQAREYYREGLEICLKLKNKRTLAEALLGFAEILCAEAQYAQSARLQGFAETLFKEAESLTETHQSDIKKSADALRVYLSEDSYQKEFNIGKTLKLEQAVKIALHQQG